MNNSLEAKIVVLGAQGVGKTSLLLRYIKNQFKAESTTSTVGASFLTKRVVDDESDITVRLQIWDTAGQERFRSISRLYYRGANACILCYSITDQSSFEEMGMWLTELRTHLPPDIILHVVGTKADIVSRDPSIRQVPFERCIAYVAENLAAGQTSTPPATATTGGVRTEAATAKHKSFLPSDEPKPDPKSPSSKRSSGFWGMEVGWDCCHEVSAESGEGVDEVFRVVTRKLVEQTRKMKEQLLIATATPGGIPGTPSWIGPPGEGAASYFERPGGKGGLKNLRPNGSFRLGRDRRSFLGFPTPGFSTEVVIDEGLEERSEGLGEEEGKEVRTRCC